MNMEILVPLTFLLAAALLMAYALRLHAASRRRSLEIVREAMEKGIPLDRETVEAIAAGYRSRFADARRGALFIAIALAMLVFSTVFDSRESSVVRGLAAFPGFSGLTYLFFHRVRLK